jgi:hypothetical protein
MPKQAAKLEDYLSEVYAERKKTPVILVETDYKIDIVSGLALVALTRRFQNDTDGPIEAVMTFPVPFNAVVTRLEAEVDGRKLIGVASAKANARETFETAIDNGKSAVLHEELLPGIHMVSVANVRSKTFIDVTAHFVAPLSAMGEDYKLRIPLTVGQVYGNSPLMNADALVSNGPEQQASVTINGAGDNCRLNGRIITGPEQTVSLGAVIELTFTLKKLAPVSSLTKDGRVVTISFGRMETRDEDMEFDILVDASGSMSNADASGKVKWNSMLDSLSDVSHLNLRDGDKLNLWSFASRTEFVTKSSKVTLAADLRTVPFTRGTTELQEAVEQVSASREAANILLLTDGKVWHLDFEKALRNGARVTVVLMGSEAMEARVGYLASLSGGQLFTCFGADTRQAIAEAVRSMRGVSEPVVMTDGRPISLTRTFGGVQIKAEWRVSKKAVASDGNAAALAHKAVKRVDGISQYAAFLAIAGMTEDKATAYAAEEGIVTHLTSIALVDEAGEAVDGLPAQHKVPLSAPAGSRGLSLLGSSGGMRSLGFTPKSMMRSAGGGQSDGAMLSASFFAESSAPLERVSGIPGQARPRRFGERRGATPASQSSDNAWFGDSPSVGSIIPRVTSDVAPPLSAEDLAIIVENAKAAQQPSVTPPAGWTLKASLERMPIDWDAYANDLSTATIDKLPLSVRARIRAISDNPAVLALATRVSRSNIELAIGLIALAAKDLSKTADRIQRRFLKDVPEADINAILQTL